MKRLSQKNDPIVLGVREVPRDFEPDRSLTFKTAFCFK